MSEKIVQLNEEIIKGQLKELVRGSGRRRDWQPHGNVPECCSTAPGKNAERAAGKGGGVADAGGPL